jgi:mono/diheme cytochrome c family protein/cytochrome c2
MFSLFIMPALLSLSACSQSGINKKVGPPPLFVSSTDPHFIKRGQYLAEHVARCISCHSERDAEVFSGPVVAGTEGMGGQSWPLSGGHLGLLTAGNLSPTGIGEWSDGQVLYAMTAGVHKDGHALFPVMPYPAFSQMTESDAKAVVSYLRTLAPVKDDPIPRRLSVVSRRVANRWAASPLWSDPPGLKDILAQGEYLSRTAGCTDCHSQQDDHKVVPKLMFGGGVAFKMSMGTAISSNISPADGYGLGYWSEEDFLNKFRAYREPAALGVEAGPGAPNTVMPWFDYAGMTDEDLKAVWAYLSAQTPIDNEVTQTWIVH